VPSRVFNKNIKVLNSPDLTIELSKTIIILNDEMLYSLLDTRN